MVGALIPKAVAVSSRRILGEARPATFGAASENLGVGRQRQHGILDAVAHRGEFARVRQSVPRDFGRRAEAGDAGEIFRAGAVTLLLAAAGDERLRHHQVRRGDESADARGTTDLVRGEDEIVGETAG